MTAARKALEALSVPPDQRWVLATWVNDDGEWVARGPKRKVPMPTRQPSDDDDDFLERAMAWETDTEAGCPSDKLAQADAARMCLAVNLAAPLAAVVRAAMERREAEASNDWGCEAGARIERAVEAEHAAIDAFDAAALAQGFTP